MLCAALRPRAAASSGAGSRLRVRRAPRSARRPKSVSAMPGLPELPLLGSIPWIPGYAKRHGFEMFQTEFYRHMHEDFGPICKFGLPGLGSGIKGTLVILADPRDMLTVLQTEQGEPFGALETLYPSIAYHQMRGNNTILAFLRSGEEWRQVRHLAQPDIFAPKAALRVLGPVAKAAELASPGFAKAGDSLRSFLGRMSFDMFCAFAIGRMTRTADESAPADPSDLEYTRSVTAAGDVLLPMIMDPRETAALKFGFHTANMKQFIIDTDRTMDRGYEITNDIFDRAERGELTEYERDSWAARAAARGQMSRRQLNEVLALFLLAAVDTTSCALMWLVLNLAQEPAAQRTLREELRSVLQGGPLTQEIWEHGRDRIPLLHACIRESHRVTPPNPASPFKVARKPVTLQGYDLPAGSAVVLNLTGYQRDEEYAGPEPNRFRPERFLPAAVAARRGTPAELLDHRVGSSPFSAGARMCLGFRVARIELAAAAARLVQDWEWELEPGQTWVAQQTLFAWPTPCPRLKIRPAPS
eukprot:TRINITY_DN20457_c0_g3_i1.p1 TRINITY_DN20457_c0_g3~~TRINITY_DN20457_c0_g3_i1.p1  ORF type:complete len:557 (+),score=144.04 TRINITY_DN20457_c0_g3_i1:87-1673(+)